MIFFSFPLTTRIIFDTNYLVNHRKISAEQSALDVGGDIFRKVVEELCKLDFGFFQLKLAITGDNSRDHAQEPGLKSFAVLEGLEDVATRN